jgi:2'-5' RNA ligase
LWVGIAQQPALTALQAQVDQALESVNFPSEGNSFTPHVTLARLKGEGNMEQVGHFLEQEAGFECEPFSVTEFHLMSSRLTPQGAEYRRETSFTLTD